MNNLAEALAWLYSNKNKVKDIQLKRISFILNELRLYPKYKVVTITGTNGKGSCATSLKNILAKNNLRVGLFTSPFILKFNERIMINDEYISDKAILKYINILYDYALGFKYRFNLNIPFFELMLLMALMYFNDKKIDLAILECGIGGTGDACNAIEPDLSIITSIGYDHLDKLGSSLKDVLINKMGIGRANKLLITALNDNLDTLESEASKRGIILDNIYNDIKLLNITNKTSFSFKGYDYTTSLIGSFQASNVSLAIEASKILYPSISDGIINEAINNTYLPGRMEVISNKPLIIVDGAHNINATIELIKSIKYFNRDIKILFQALGDKDYKEMLKLLNEVAIEFNFTIVNDPRALEIDKFIPYISKPYHRYLNISDAINNISVNESELLLVAGSLHFAGEFINTYRKNK